MRVAETVTKSGYFWLPPNRDRALPGNLTVSDGGKIELEVLGFFEGHSPFGQDLNIGRIVGLVERDGYVTLEDCFYKNSTTSSGGISKAQIFVHRALFRIGYDKDEPVVLDEFRFSVEGLSAWLGLTGIQQSITLPSKEPFTISYVPQDEIVLDLGDGHQLAFGLSSSFPGSPANNEAKITEKAYIRLFAATPKPLDDFIQIARYLTNLLCFATDHTVTIDSASGRTTNPPTEKDGEPERLDMNIVYPSLPFSDRPSNPEWHEMLFRFPQVREGADEMIKKWLGAYEVFQPALDLYFSATTGAHRYLDTRFLALAQAAETLHRRTSSETFLEEIIYQGVVEEVIEGCPEEYRDWLSRKLRYGNEISLARRLKRLIQPFEDRLGTKDERKRLIRRIVDTRNYLTHYDESLKSKAATRSDLYQLCNRLEAILQLCFFSAIGFANEQIGSIIDSTERLRHKLKD